MDDDAPVALLNHVRQNGERRRKASIAVGEHVYVRAFRPINVGWGMDRFLHISPVKVYRRLCLWE
jgi:hypothetical protein